VLDKRLGVSRKEREKKKRSLRARLLTSVFRRKTGKKGQEVLYLRREKGEREGELLTPIVADFSSR